MNLKTQLKQMCKSKLQRQISDFQTTIAMLQEDSHAETKSSMGDKYETSKAMVQMELDKIARQLQLLQSQSGLLDSLPETKMEIASSGALVFTNSGCFFLSIPLGKMEVEKQEYIAISQASPLGQAMKFLRKGGSFTLNSKIYTITDIV